MKERPILFSAPMVRAILDGRKTQTRRVVAPRITLCTDPGNPVERDDMLSWCPYGIPGDRLWVRETWGQLGSGKPNPQVFTFFRADPSPPSHLCFPPGFHWRPSIHMPRWASRITLEITEVRVERLHDMTIGEAHTEGAPFDLVDGWEENPDGTQSVPKPSRDAVDWFRALWDSLNAKRGHGWEVNPWVWVISFRRTKP